MLIRCDARLHTIKKWQISWNKLSLEKVTSSLCRLLAYTKCSLSYKIRPLQSDTARYWCARSLWIDVGKTHLVGCNSSAIYLENCSCFYTINVTHSFTRCALTASTSTQSKLKHFLTHYNFPMCPYVLVTRWVICTWMLMYTVLICTSKRRSMD